jgi:hypothetical protein
VKNAVLVDLGLEREGESYYGGLEKDTTSKEGKLKGQIDLSLFKGSDAADAMTGAELDGVISIPFLKTIVLAKMPFRIGESIMVRNHRVTVLKVEQTQDAIDYHLIQETPSIAMRGGEYAVHDDNIEFLVVNWKRGEFLDDCGAYGSFYQRYGHYLTQECSRSCKIWPSNDKKKIPSGWLDGAELLILGNEYGPTLTKPFHFKNIDLSLRP